MVDASQHRSVPASPAPDPLSLSKLVYRSRASDAFSPEDLGGLLRTAVDRNGREELTGTLVYDRGRFVQWLEGPNDALARVYSSIRDDPRHMECEVLQAHPVRERTFRDWRMRLALRKSGSRLVPQAALGADDSSMDTLMSYPEAAPSLLRVIFDEMDVPAAKTNGHLRDTVETVVSGLGFGGLFPGEENAGGSDSDKAEQLRKLRACSTELARLFSAERGGAGAREVEAICRAAARGLDDFVRLFGLTAGALGDLWHDNRCKEADIAVALSELQIVYSRMRRHGVLQPDRDISDFRVMVTHMPRDMHIVGTILKAEVLRSRGWDTAIRFPASDDELADEIRGEAVDAVVLSASRVISDPAMLPRVERLIARLRAAPGAEAVPVIVGGRIFTDRPGALRAVGADAHADNALALPALLRGMLTG